MGSCLTRHRLTSISNLVGGRRAVCVVWDGGMRRDGTGVAT